MNALQAILTGDVFNYRHNEFNSDEGIGFVIDNTLSYYEYIDFVLNESNHEITERMLCNLCRIRGYEPIRRYNSECLHFSCYEMIKKVVDSEPLFHIKLVFGISKTQSCNDNSSELHLSQVSKCKKEILLPVHVINSNSKFITINGSNIEFYGVGYGRPCSYGDFHCMISNTHLSLINDADKKKNYLIAQSLQGNSGGACRETTAQDKHQQEDLIEDEYNTCCMCVDDYECIYRFNGLNQYCEDCIRLVLNIQTSILQKYMLFNEVLLNDITKHITMNILDIYESITEQ